MKNALQIVASRGWGGGERYVYDLVEQLTLKGWTVTVIGRKSDILASKFGQYKALRLKSMFDIGSAFKLARIIKSSAIDVIHVHIFKDAFLAALAVKLSGQRVKIVMTRHLVRPGKGGALYKWMYKSIDSLIFVSNSSRDMFLSSDPPIESSKIVTIYNSVKVEGGPHVYGNGTLTIGFAARLDVEKGVEVLIEALKKINDVDFRVSIAGTGNAEYVASIEKLIAPINDKVTLVGFVDDMELWRRGIDIGVVPSLVAESFSLVALEFMASGIVVVASDSGGPTEIIDNGVDGYLFPVGNSDALAERLRKLIENREQLTTVGAEAVKKYRTKFGFESFIDKIVAQYEKRGDC